MRDPNKAMNRLEEVNKKIESVRDWLQTHGQEALLVNSQANFAWLTGGGESYVYIGDSAGVAYLLVVPDRTYLLTNNIEERRLDDEEIVDLPFEPVIWPWHRGSEAKERLANLCDVTKAVSDLGSLALPKVADGFNELRYTMLPPEILRYRLLGLEAAQAVEDVFRN